MNQDKDKEDNIPAIFILSGGKGLAGNAVVQSVLIQFPNNKIPVIILPNITSKDKVAAAIDRVYEKKGVIVHTMVDPEVRKNLIKACDKRGVRHFDLVGDLSDYLSNTLDIEPISKPGLYRLSNIEYFERVEAIEFTLKHDDGQYVDRIEKADIVLTGVSRTGKTPLSVYLAMFGWKVANVPLVKGIDVPDALFTIDPKRVFGLDISINYLIAQRANRVRALNMSENDVYINKRAVREEIDFAKRIFERGGFTTVKITNKPIESSANEILTMLTSRFERDNWKK